MDSTPKLDRIQRHAGTAGQFSYTVEVTYPDETADTLTFVGSTYGGPIIMITATGRQHIVTRGVTERIGSKLDPTWIRRFFGLEA